MVKSGETEQAAATFLKDTFSADKNELLFTRFGCNYNTLDPMYRKGTVLVRDMVDEQHQAPDGRVFSRAKSHICTVHDDIISDAPFWHRFPVIPLPAPTDTRESTRTMTATRATTATAVATAATTAAVATASAASSVPTPSDSIVTTLPSADADRTSRTPLP
jgi:tRNA(His) guanylyltransferase